MLVFTLSSHRHDTLAQMLSYTPQTWNSEGTLLGKFFLGTTSANMVFAGKGRLVILAETKIFLAKIAAEGFDLGGN